MITRKPVLLILLTVILCSTLPIWAQNDSPWYWNIEIRNFTITGLQNVSENDIRAVVDQYLGIVFTEVVFNDIQRRLYNLELFDLVLIEVIPGNEARTELVLNIILEERPVLSAIEFDGNLQIRRGTLLDEILISEGDIPLQSQIRNDQNKLIELYRDRGFSDATVEFMLGDIDENNFQTLTFVIVEGDQTNVQSIVFSGINFASENQLLEVLATKQQGLFNSGTFKASNFELDRQAILNFYGEFGYIDAQVLNIEQEEIISQESGRRFLEITYYIEEGIPWFFGNLEFEGNIIFSDEELRNQFFVRTGDILNFPLFQQGVQSLGELYYQGGYIFNQIDVIEERNNALQQVNYTITIVETNRAYIENIIIRGNTKTRDDVILRELPFEEGDVFSAPKIRQGIANLYNTQFFADVPTIDTPQGSVHGLMELVINVEEGQTTDLRFGFTVGGSSDFPVAGILRWTDSNFLGNGQVISADLNVSLEQQSIDFTFFDPWLFGDRWSGGAGIELSRTLVNNALQDILHPIFQKNDPNAVPDPFEGYYVFSKNTSYKGTNYLAGQAVPDVPSTQEISEHSLVTDYAYFTSRGGNINNIASSFKTEYVEWLIRPNITTGIRIPSVIGWLGANAGLSIGFRIIDYDETLSRPFSATIRDNLRQLRLANSFSLRFSLDGRDVFFNPQNGYFLEQRFFFAGGLLGGSLNYIRTDTTLQGFLRLVDVEVSPTWSFKLIIAANLSLSFVLDQFFAYEGSSTFQVDALNLLRTNSMTIARGWPRQVNGQALFNSWFEVRMPIVEQVLWFDLYVEAVRLTPDRDIFAPGFENWLFGFGAGLRFSIQQFPFSLYLGKRFDVQNGEVNWKRGNIFADPNDPASGIDLIFAINIFQL